MQSRISCCNILAVYLAVRLISLDFQDVSKNKFTDSDGLGYYMYLPSVFIYQDITHYKWLPDIEKQYHVYGGERAFQISQHKNGNYVTNYLGGVAIMQAPFFFVGHLVAISSVFKADGFSAPYQLAIGFAPFVYLCFFLFLLRSILLRYYDDYTTAIGLVLMFLGSNAIEYIAVEAGQCHGYILPLYVLIIYLSIKWHSTPKFSTALGIGLTIGLATIMRPTELIMIFVPLFWNTHTKEAKDKKWQLVNRHRTHIMYAGLGCLIASLPQILYWYYVTGSFINTIGSKWRFLDPYWRVIVGWEKGWFIYTPITILFVLGLFFMKKYPFRKSVIWFCIINIWIIISWNNWHYGGSYSTRALVQSYPVFALALTAIVGLILKTRWRSILYIVGMYLICVNIFQVWQYRKTIIHYRDMNFEYYKAVYLNRNPTPLDMSLLDGGERLDITMNHQKVLMEIDSTVSISHSTPIYKANLSDHENFEMGIEVYLDLLIKSGYWTGKIYIQYFKNDEIVQENRFRTFHAMTEKGKRNIYQMQTVVPNSADRIEVGFLETEFEGMLYEGKVVEHLF